VASTPRAAVGVEVDANPERVALDRGKLAFEAHPLAGKRGFEIGVIKLIEIAAVDFDDFKADDFGLGAAAPIEESAIDEAVALVRVDIADRKTERVELALRQRQQGVALQPFARGLERGMI